MNDAVLLYDGLCGFCDGTVQFVLARDRRGTLRFAPLQGTLAAEVLARHPELAGLDSLILVRNTGAPGESAAVRSDAALGVAEYLGGVWSLAGVFRLLPRVLRDWGYDLFARNRYRLFGRRDACRIPTAETRARFLA